MKIYHEPQRGHRRRGDGQVGAAGYEGCHGRHAADTAHRQLAAPVVRTLGGTIE